MSIVKNIHYKLSHLFYFFMVYSFLGWCIETIYMSFCRGHFVNRGFLYGPFLPIYGFGALILLLLLNPLKKNLLLLFLGAVVVLSVLEYITGFIFETCFNYLLWDYSDNPLNLYGRIWIGASLNWGLLGVLLITRFHPCIERFYNHIPAQIKTIAACCLISYLILDTTATSAVTLDIGDQFVRLHLPLKAIKAVMNRLVIPTVLPIPGITTILLKIGGGAVFFYPDH